MRRLLCVVAALIGPPLAAQATGTGYDGTTRAQSTLHVMFTQSGSFGFPPYAADPFTCSAAVSVERSIYYNTTSHTNYFCNGTAWTALGGSSGSTFLDGSFVIQNTADHTKKFAFDASGLSPGFTRSFSLPNISGTLATLANINQTFSGNVTSPNVVGSTSLQALGSGSANGITLNSTGIVFDGPTVDAFTTTLGVVDPTASSTFTLPNSTAGTYPILTGANVVTLAQGGTGLTTAADDTVPVSSGAAWVAKTLPACTDTGGNHLNYDQASNAFSCGTSGASSFLDGSFQIKNTADPTKIAAFDSSAIGAGTTKTFTLPNASGTIPLLGQPNSWTDRQTYTNTYGVAFTSATTGTIVAGNGSIAPTGGLSIATGTASNSVRVHTITGWTTDVKNGPCGTSSCTDPTFMVFSHNMNLGEYISIQHDGSNGVIQTGTGAIAVQAGTGTGRGLVGGALNTNISPVGNGADVTEDTLMTYSLPLNSLTANGRGVELHAWGTTTNNADTKALKCYFGATAIMTQALTVSIAGVWDVRATVLRTGAAGEEAIATLSSQGAAGAAMVTVLDTQPAADTTGAIVIKCTGQANAATANDIKQNGMTVEYIN